MHIKIVKIKIRGPQIWPTYRGGIRFGQPTEGAPALAKLQRGPQI